MHRVLLSSLCLASGALAGDPKFAFVSQTAKGTLNATVGSLFGSNTSVAGSFDLAVHAGLGSFRLKLYTTDKGDGDLLFSSTEKLIYQDVPEEGCSVTKLPHLPEPAKFLACVAGLVEKGREESKDPEGNSVFFLEDNRGTSKVGPIPISTTVGGFLSVDGKGAVAHAVIVYTVLPLILVALDARVTDSTLGEPDEAVFAVPPLDHCKEVDLPSDVSKLSEVEQAWLTCVAPALAAGAGEALII